MSLCRESLCERGMKKIMISLMLAFIAVAATACGEKTETINVYNWGDYIDETVLEEFEKETGIEVNYDTFATNEDLYVKLKQGGSSYDVVFPSDYMIERMIREDLLQKIDKAKLTNLKEVAPGFLGLDYDKAGDYSAPYMWGTVGIIYNTTLVNDEVKSWDILWNEKYEGQIVMLNSQRDTLAVALKKLGYSLNTRSEKELEEAKDELIRQKPLVYAYLGDEIKDVVIAGEAALAVVWSGDAMVMMDSNPDLQYVIPDEGSNLWFDSMVVPKSAKNKEGAEKFIDFMLRPDIAAKNAEYIGYSTPITKAVEMLPEEIRESLVAYPTDEMIENCEVFKDPMDIISVYDRIWTEITSAK